MKKPVWSKQELIAKFGSRARAARELAGFTQDKAAELLGYKNSSKLSKVESAKNQTCINTELAVKMARLYDVSTDYLFGLTDDCDETGLAVRTGQMQAWFIETLNTKLPVIFQHFYILELKVHELEKVLPDLIRDIENVRSTFVSFKQRNIASGIYDDCIFGNKLENDIAQVYMLSNLTKQTMLQCKMRVQSFVEKQSDLFPDL